MLPMKFIFNLFFFTKCNGQPFCVNTHSSVNAIVFNSK